MAEHEILSCHLSKILDKLGHSRQMREFRRAAYQELDQLINIQSPYRTIVTGGSKGEGLTKPYESDIDNLYFSNYVVCVGENIDTDMFGVDMTVFTMNSRYCYPGYTLLALVRTAPTTVPIDIYSSLSPSPTGQYFLSSNQFGEYHLQRNRSGNDDWVSSRAGPATSSSLGRMHYDHVHSIRCMCPSILDEWIMRPRQYEWPSLALGCAALQIGANVVAKGFKESQVEHFEWRICFNEIELLLVNSLSDTQTKLYILLKVIMKNVLKPIEKEITSYVIKNIVFWLAEWNPQVAFNDKTLLHWTLKSLRLLKKSIQAQYLPYFMIPDRNLMVERIKPRLKNRLVRRLTCLIQEGPCLLWRCKKLTVTRLMTQVELNMFGAMRDELEVLWLTQQNYCLFLVIQGLSVEQILNDEIYDTIIRRIVEFTISNWPRFIHQQFNAYTPVEERTQIILSY